MTELHASVARKPGHMTAAMRVLPFVAGPKVLRIGIADQGRIVDERLIKQQGDVTVGAQESCTFVVASPLLANALRLFEFDSGGYLLTFLEGMTGMVVLPGGARDLEALKIPTNRRMDGSYRIALTDSSRGKIVMGGTVVLFQFVDQPLPAPRPQLPTSVQSGLSSQIDWRFTVIAAFSFVLHFGLLGMVYSDWADQAIDDVATITGVVDSVMALPNLTPPADVRAHEADGEVAPAAPQPNQQGGRVAGNSHQHAQPGTGRTTERGGMKDGERARLREQLEQMDFGVVSTLNGAGPATQGVLRAGETPMGSLEQMARRNTGVGATNGNGLNLGAGDGRVAPGGEQNGFGSLLPIPGPANPATTGSAVAVKPPPTPATVVATPQPAGPKIRNLEGAVARLRPGFRQCYTKVGLDINPDMEGLATLTLQVGANGEVTSARASAGGTVSSAVANCIAGVGKRAQFDPPEGGVGTTVVVPIQLRHQ